MACVINYNNKTYSLEDFKNILLKDLSLVKEVANKSQERLKATQEVFNSNPELSKVGDVFSYAIYLDTIFPDSKAKDIVYHGTKEKYNLTDFGKNNLGKNTGKNREKGYYFGKLKDINPYITDIEIEFDPETGESYPIAKKIGITIPALLNNPTIIKERDEDQFGYGNIIEYDSYLVKDLSQIYILGSKQDVEGFKEFIKNNVAYSRIPGWSQRAVNSFVDDIINNFRIEIIGDNKQILFEGKRFLDNEFFDRIKQDENYIDIDDATWNELVVYTKDKMSSVLGIRFRENENEESIDDENHNKHEYVPEHFTLNPDESASGAIKLMLSTYPKTVATPQPVGANLEKPKAKTDETWGGVQLANYKRLFITMMNKFSNVVNPYELIKRFEQLARSDSDFVRVFYDFGGKPDGSFALSELNKYGWRLFAQLYQTFTRQTPDALVQYDDGFEVYLGDASNYSTIDKMKKSWTDKLKMLSQENGSVVMWSAKEKTYKISDEFKKKFPTSPAKTVEGAISFLSAIGIDVSKSTVDKFRKSKSTNEKTSQLDGFLENVNAIYDTLLNKGVFYDVQSKELGVGARFAKIADDVISIENPLRESTHIGVDGNRRSSVTEDNAASIFEDEVNEVNTHDELIAKRPELRDVFAKRSVLFKKGGKLFHKDGEKVAGASIKVGVIEGEKNTQNDKGIPITKVTEGKRLIMNINKALEGWWDILIPGDSTTQWMMQLGEFFKYEDAYANSYTTLHEIFNGYLQDEIELALDHETRSKLKNMKGRAKQLRFMREILHEDLVKGIEELIEKDDKEGIADYIKANQNAINESFIDFIDKAKERIKASMKQNGQLTPNGETYRIKNLSNKASTFKIKKGEVTQKQLDSLLFYIAANNTIANTEFHKVLVGDPYQFAEKNGNLDETKRIKSLLGPRRKMLNIPEFNEALGRDYNKAGEIELDKNEFGHWNFRSYARTITTSDVEFPTPNFGKVNETDAFSIIIDAGYREVKLKNGEWSDEAEEWYQWQMAYTRKNSPDSKYKYTNEKLRAQDEKILSKPEPNFKVEVLKPIVSGSKNNKNHIETVIDKMSQMPLFYKAAKERGLEELYWKMHKEEITYVVMNSGRKVGETSSYSLYKNGTEINTDPFGEELVEEINWKYYGLQLENSYSEGKEQRRGSQITKLCSMDLFELGVAVSPEAQAKYEANRTALIALLENGYKRLLKKLNIEDTGSGYTFMDETSPAAILEILKDELLSRNFSNNTRETLMLNEETGQFKMMFESSNQYYKIRDILYSLVDKAITSSKMHGAPKVQAPVTLWEDAKKGRKMVQRKDDGKGNVTWKNISREEYNALSDEEKKNVHPSSDTLKFYKNAEGQRVCQVMLPHWFKDKFGNKTDEEIIDYLRENEPNVLKGIGFRIPTQAMSSIEVFEVAGFVPQFMGDTIIVPSEITAKAGSDFDIDKLNTYLKSVYKDEDGNVRMYRMHGSEEETKLYYKNVYKQTIWKDIEKINNFNEFRERLISIFEQSEDALERGERPSSVLSEEDLDFYDNHASKIKQIVEQAFEKGVTASQYIRNQQERLAKANEQLTLDFFNKEMMNDFVETAYQRSLENAYYQTLEDMVSLPENFERLMSPVSNAGLDKMAERMDDLTNNQEEKIKGRLLDMAYLTKLRHYFLAAKSWVGIGAVNVTGHSQFQKANITVNFNRIKGKLSKWEKKILYDGKVHIEHNEDADGNITLSKRENVDGDYISDRLSGYITSFVDAVKDPYIAKLILHDKVVGVFMMLERMGCGETSLIFMNQPIIREYLIHLASIEAKGLYNSTIIENFLKNFGGALFNPLKDEVKDFTRTELETNIRDYYHTEGGFSETQRLIEQQQIFYEFLKYAKMAEHLFKFTQAINFDTTKFRNSASYYRKVNKQDDVRNNNIFCCLDDVLDNTFLNAHIEFQRKGMAAVAPILKTEEIGFASIINKVLDPYVKESWMSNDTFDRVVNKLKASFIDYILLTKNTDITSQMFNLLVNSETSIAKLFRDAKVKHPNLQIFDYIEFDIPTGVNAFDGTKTLRTKVSIDGAYEEDLYREAMYELKDVAPELYREMITIAILQGTYQNAVSIKTIIPVDDYAATTNPIISSANASELNDFEKQNWFQRNNWKDDDIVPPISWNFKQDRDNEDYYTSDIKKNIKGSTKDFLFKKFEVVAIPEDRFDSEVGYDVIKTRRVVKDQLGNNIDVFSGAIVESSKYAKHLQNENPELFMTHGYKKVKYANDTPVITADGRHIYKRINLLGDGQHAVEYYGAVRQSVLNNMTVKVDERTDEEIIAILGLTQPVVQEVEEVAPLQLTSASSETRVSYKGGFENVGKGTPEGDGKDKAMREVADGFIGEITQESSSSAKSLNYISIKVAKKYKLETKRAIANNLVIQEKENTKGILYEDTKVVMLARNSEFKNKPLSDTTKKAINNAFQLGVEFIVGDMPNVDSQFIDYLQEIGAKFTIYHTGTTSRIIVNETQYSIPVTEESIYNSINVTLLNSNYPYTKTTASNDRSTNFVFTENAEAYVASTRYGNQYLEEFPYKYAPKLNVTSVNNQAGIRTDDSGNINKNAVGIIVKKFQQNSSGQFVKQEGSFRDTEEDFKMFVDLNTHAFNRLISEGKPVVIPNQFALGKAALPLRFAKWLQNKLLQELGVITEIKENITSGYEGYGLQVISISIETIASPISNREESYIETAKSINVYYNTNENRELSNLQERTFTFDGREYKSVEHAYQTLKSGKFNESVYNRPNDFVGTKRNTPTNVDKSTNLSLMKSLVKASFEQNPSATKALLATGNSNITHTQDNGIWKTEFPKILMEVRNELRETSHHQQSLLQNFEQLPQQDDFLSAAAEIQKSLEQKQQEKEKQMEIPTPNTTSYKYYGAVYTIVLNEEGKGIDVIGYKGKNINKQKLLDAFNVDPYNDPQVKMESVENNVIEFNSLPEFTNEQREQILTNFAKKHYQGDKTLALKRINEALSKDRKNTIDKLKECYL